MRTLPLAFMLCALMPNSAFAWGPEGHALIGKIADQLLDGTAAGAKVDGILKSYTLQEAAKWPDCVRSVVHRADGSFHYTQGKYTAPCKAFESPDEVQRMEDYAARNWDTAPHPPTEGAHTTYHYADIPIQIGGYTADGIGTNDHDVVHAINAAIAELKHQPVPPPFSIKDDKEALLLLAHFVGDLHQPLHVGAAYIDEQGTLINPTSEQVASTDTTQGGNLIFWGTGDRKLHAEWDALQPPLAKTEFDTWVQSAKGIPVDTALSPEVWPTAWASESVKDAQVAYSGISFTYVDSPRHWQATFTDRKKYLAAEYTIKRRKIAEAGERLAAILQSIWP